MHSDELHVRRALEIFSLSTFARRAMAAAGDAGRDDVRPADFAITGNRLILDFIERIWTLRYKTLKKRKSIGAALELMVVSMQTSVWTREKKPPTLKQLTDKWSLSPKTTKRHLDTLIEEGGVTKK